MIGRNNKMKEIALGDDLGDVAVSVNGVRIIIRTDGSVKFNPVANDEQRTVGGSTPEIGRLVEGKGVYVGTWTPKDRFGNSLGKTFNLFAAPYDLGLDEHGKSKKLVTTYNKAVLAVAKITNLMGFKGTSFENDSALYKALKDGSYNGEWFIPSKDALSGNLYNSKDKFTLENAFVTTRNGSDHALWYWSCTEHPDNSSSVYSVNFTDGDDDWDGKDYYKLSVRPVRAELRP